MFSALLLFSALYLDDAWALPKSESLTIIAQEIADSEKLPYRVTVFTPDEWRTHGIVNAKIFRWEEGARAVILISPLLVDSFDEQSIRAVIAHELGHTTFRCRPRPRGAGNEECEEKADVFSARVVGRRNAIRSLCQLVAVGWEHRVITDASDIYARIKHFHNRNDIP
jgi:hypothetical protein